MTIDHPKAKVILADTFIFVPGWLSKEEADEMYEKLKVETYTSDKGRGGRKAMQRFVDEGVQYLFKGRPKPVRPWTPTLLEIRRRLEALAHSEFNCVVVNRYENERQALPLHSDTGTYIPQLGDEPTIASVSFGETRDFQLQCKATKEIVPIPLSHGDLFFMMGKSQQEWKHGVPKCDTPKELRISLTFRKHL